MSDTMSDDLIKLLAAVAARDTTKASSLATAAGETDEVALIAAGSPDGTTALGIASKLGFADVVRALLTSEAADRNIARKTTTPLMVAVMRGHVEVVGVLLRDAAVDANRKRRDGVTALHLAVQAKQLTCLRSLLLHRRTKPSVRSLFPQRVTPLILALMMDNADAVALILQSDRLDFDDNAHLRQTPQEFAAEAAPSCVEFVAAFARGGVAAVRELLVAEARNELLLAVESESEGGRGVAPGYDFAAEIALVAEVAAVEAVPAAALAKLFELAERLQLLGEGAGGASSGGQANGGGAMDTPLAASLPALRLRAVDSCTGTSLSGSCWDVSSVRFAVNTIPIVIAALDCDHRTCSSRDAGPGWAARLATAGEGEGEGESGDWGGRADAEGAFWIGVEITDAAARAALRQLVAARAAECAPPARVSATLVQCGGAHSTDAVALELRAEGEGVVGDDDESEKKGEEWITLQTFGGLDRKQSATSALHHGLGAPSPSASESAPAALQLVEGSYRARVRDGLLPRCAASATATWFDAGAEGIFIPVESDSSVDAVLWERRKIGASPEVWIESARDSTGVDLEMLGGAGCDCVRLTRDALIRTATGACLPGCGWRDGPAVGAPPWHYADVIWTLAPNAAPLASISIDVTVHVPPEHGCFYIAPAFARLAVLTASTLGVDSRLRHRDANALSAVDAAQKSAPTRVPFYGGIQTSTNGVAPESSSSSSGAGKHAWRELGSAAIFSRWDVRSRDALRLAGDGAAASGGGAPRALCGWESGGYEGQFVSVRRTLACPLGTAMGGVPTSYTCTWTVRHVAIAIASASASPGVEAHDGAVDAVVQTWLDMSVTCWPLDSPAQRETRDVGGLLFAELRALIPAALTTLPTQHRDSERSAELHPWAPRLQLGATIEAFVELYGVAVPTTATPTTDVSFSNVRVNGSAAPVRSITAYRGASVPANAKAWRPHGEARADASALRVATSPFPFGPAQKKRTVWTAGGAQDEVWA
jgi:hypothetical protein